MKYTITNILSSDISEDLDIANKLFPTWPTMLATLIALMISFAFITKLVYKPVKKMFDDRRKYIQNNIDETENKLADAKIEREIASKEILEAKVITDKMITKARKDSEDLRLQLLNRAKDDARRIIEVTKSEMEVERLKFEKESKEKVIEVAMLAAQKVIEKEVDSTTNKKLVSEFIEGKY